MLHSTTKNILFSLVLFAFAMITSLAFNSCIPDPTQTNNPLPPPHNVEATSSDLTITLKIHGNYNEDYYSHFGGFNIYYGHFPNESEQKLIYIEDSLPTLSQNATSSGDIVSTILLNKEIKFKYKTKINDKVNLETFYYEDIYYYSNYYFTVKPVNNLDGTEGSDGQIIANTKPYYLIVDESFSINSTQSSNLVSLDNNFSFYFIPDSATIEASANNELLLLGYRNSILRETELPTDNYNSFIIPAMKNQLFAIKNDNDYAKIFIKNINTENITFDVAYQENGNIFK